MLLVPLSPPVLVFAAFRHRSRSRKTLALPRPPQSRHAKCGEAGRARPRCERSVRPSYDVRNNPRRCSSGRTSAMNLSSISGRTGGIRLKPSAAPSSTHASIKFTSCSGVPSNVKCPRAPASLASNWRRVGASCLTKPTMTSVRLRAASLSRGSGKSLGTSFLSSGRCEKSWPPKRNDSRCRPISAGFRQRASTQNRRARSCRCSRATLALPPSIVSVSVSRW